MAYHLTHPDSEQEIEVDKEQVPNYQSQGWQINPHATPPQGDKE